MVRAIDDVRTSTRPPSRITLRQCPALRVAASRRAGRPFRHHFAQRRALHERRAPIERLGPRHARTRTWELQITWRDPDICQLAIDRPIDIVLIRGWHHDEQFILAAFSTQFPTPRVWISRAQGLCNTGSRPGSDIAPRVPPCLPLYPTPAASPHCKALGPWNPLEAFAKFRGRPPASFLGEAVLVTSKTPAVTRTREGCG